MRMKPTTEDAIRRWLWLRGKVTDERGRRRPAYASRDRWWSKIVQQEIPEPEFRALREAGMKRLGWVGRLASSRWLPWLLLAAAALPVAAGFAMGYSLPAVALRAAVFVGLLYTALRAAHRLPSHDGPLMRTLLLQAQRCPACAQSLRGLREEQDRCVVCPECGGAWRLLPRASPGGTLSTTFAHK